MKILEQNVKKWTSGRAAPLIGYLLQQNADILCLSEHREGREAVVAKSMLMDSGYAHHYVSVDALNPRAGGILVAARYRLELIPEQSWSASESWRLLALDAGGFGLSVCYWPQKNLKDPFWRDWLAFMKLQNRPHLSIGDFNTGRNDIDKSDAGAAFHCAEYFDHLDEAGVVDMWRHQHPHLREYSWYSAAGNGFRIDHAFGNHAMHAMVDRCWYDHAVRESALSDHSALCVELRI